MSADSPITNDWTLAKSALATFLPTTYMRQVATDCYILGLWTEGRSGSSLPLGFGRLNLRSSLLQAEVAGAWTPRRLAPALMQIIEELGLETGESA